MLILSLIVWKVLSHRNIVSEGVQPILWHRCTFKSGALHTKSYQSQLTHWLLCGSPEPVRKPTMTLYKQFTLTRESSPLDFPMTSPMTLVWVSVSGVPFLCVSCPPPPAYRNVSVIVWQKHIFPFCHNSLRDIDVCWGPFILIPHVKTSQQTFDRIPLLIVWSRRTSEVLQTH